MFSVGWYSSFITVNMMRFISNKGRESGSFEVMPEKNVGGARLMDRLRSTWCWVRTRTRTMIADFLTPAIVDDGIFILELRFQEQHQFVLLSFLYRLSIVVILFYFSVASVLSNLLECSKRITKIPQSFITKVLSQKFSTPCSPAHWAARDDSSPPRESLGVCTVFSRQRLLLLTRQWRMQHPSPTKRPKVTPCIQTSSSLFILAQLVSCPTVSWWEVCTQASRVILCQLG